MKKIFILGFICLLFTISSFSQSKKEWEKVQTLNSWNVYKQFILNYPNGKYTKLAKEKLAQLKEPEINVNKIENNKTSNTVLDEEKANPVIIAQPGDQIRMQKHSAYLNDKKLTSEELKSLLLSQPESAKEYNKSRSTATTGFAFAIIGAGFGIYSTYESISSTVKDVNNISNGDDKSTDPAKYLVPSVIATGCEILGGFLLFSSASQHKKSITIFNSRQTTGFNNDRKLELGITKNGIGMVYCF